MILLAVTIPDWLLAVFVMCAAALFVIILFQVIGYFVNKGFESEQRKKRYDDNMAKWEEVLKVWKDANEESENLSNEMRKLINQAKKK